MINYQRISQIAREQLSDREVAQLLPLIDADVANFLSDKEWPVERAINAACQMVRECGYRSLREFIGETK